MVVALIEDHHLVLLGATTQLLTGPFAVTLYEHFHYPALLAAV